MTRPTLDERLSAAGVAPGTEPVTAWQLLHTAEGPSATVLDLYDLVARRRGLAGWELSKSERYELAHTVMPLVWPGFTTTDDSSRSSDMITVIAYDATWPRHYARWHAVVAGCLGNAALRIEHVGSTAVPGLAAKPIIDIQVSVSHLDDEDRYVTPLEAVGLQLRSRDDYHRYFRPFPGQPRDVHVHVCATGSDWEREHLLFRDYLRTHATARDAYAKVKRRAAERWSDDGIAYTDAKTEVILAIMAEAGDQSA